MKSIFEIITILIFLFIITLFQKMDESYCDSTYYPTIAMPPCKPTAIVVSASYKENSINAKPAKYPPHSIHPHKMPS